ncbi:hypothetical protein L9F63_007962 [Diploptera punctata]|uniref:Tower domain-containing protein n=1 Tax=Diploptera punctata TaxID=6984 RepID=A0AAD7Z6X3_DIPPU|nr:hypothetical protein L9F63_007962 [Diploptera punctata]
MYNQKNRETIRLQHTICQAIENFRSEKNRKICKSNYLENKNVAAEKQAAADAQDALIKHKLSLGATSRPCKGGYYLSKQQTHLQRTWQEVVEGEAPGNYTSKQLLAFGVKESTTNVTSENAIEFRFSAWDYYSVSVCRENTCGIPVGDGAQLVLDAKGTAGVEEVKRAFLSSLGLEPALVPAGWVTNQYRWLVWKLAATECSFPQQFAARCLTPNMLLLQLKYRYDREIDDCQRPAIRKILEHDDSPARRLVLCVARIIKPGENEQYELELTDGWYGIITSVDQELTKRIHRGTVSIGTKLISYGAELVNCEQACSPLEVGSEVRLKLFSNSTRRARWDAKLGYCTNPGPLPISLSSILPSGGLVSCVTLTVVTVYPTLYVEKQEGGKSVLRSVRAEERANAVWERKRQESVEVLYSQVRKELSQEDAKNTHVKQWHVPSAQELSLISSGEQLAQILELAPDPASVEVLLNEEQKFAVTNYQREKNERIQQELQVRVQEKLKEKASVCRNVVELLKMRCVDPSIPFSSKSAVMSIWRPSEDVPQLLKEGSTLKVFNVQAAGFSLNLELSAGRQTSFKPVARGECDLYRRTVTRLSETMSSDFQPPFGELDAVGMVVYVTPPPQANSGFQTVYLADSDTSILGVAFWGGIKHFCWEDVLRVKTLVSASNLQWRHGAAVRWIPCAYASELSLFSTHPRQSHLQEALGDLTHQVQEQGMEKFYGICEEKVVKLLQGAVSPGLIPTRGGGGLGFRTPTNKRERQASPGSVHCHLNASKLPGPLQELHLTSTSIIEYADSPLDRRLDKLRQYGDAPPVSMDVIIPVLPSVRKEFHFPKKISSPAESPPLSLDSDPG